MGTTASTAEPLATTGSGATHSGEVVGGYYIHCGYIAMRYRGNPMTHWPYWVI